MQLKAFLDRLDQEEHEVPLDTLVKLMTDVEFDERDVAHCIEFDENCYRRNLLHEGPAYQALILCWGPGQRSPIHDHRGSACGVRVVRGEATETQFRRGRGGMLMATWSRTKPCGSVCGSYDADIHIMANHSTDEPLITLHVYTPPLLKMGTYSLTDTSVGEFEDPVYRTCHAANL